MDDWETAAVAAVERFRREDPAGWRDYVAEMERQIPLDAPIPDEDLWDDRAPSRR